MQWHWPRTRAWIVLGLWHDAQGTEQGGGALPGLWGAGPKGLWEGGSRKEQDLSIVLCQEGLSRPRKVLEHRSEMFEEWAQLGGLGSRHGLERCAEK